MPKTTAWADHSLGQNTRRTVDPRIECVAHDNCTNRPIPEAPVALCGYHMRRVYQFAADFIEQRADEAIREHAQRPH